MTTADYPTLFSRSDSASLCAQNTYFRLLGAQLLLFVVASAIGTIAAQVDNAFRHPLSVIIAVVLAVGLVLMWSLRVQAYEKVWFDCRAVAESVKTATWRYVMQAPPYDYGDSASVDGRFLNTLAEVRRARPGVEKHLVGFASPRSEISDRMRATRNLPLDGRREIYLRNRVLDQKVWYEEKARANRSSSSIWFWTVFGLQTFALILAILQSAVGLGAINSVSIVMTLAAAFIAWTQAKQHEELAESYARAAQELSALESLAPHVSDSKRLQQFVADVEEAISREHTMWRARRNLILESTGSQPSLIEGEKR